MGMNGVISLIGVVVGMLALLPLIIGAVFVVVVVANRADPDPSGRRPGVVYGFATGFLTLFATLFASTALVAALCQLIGTHRQAAQRFAGFAGVDQVGGFGGHLHPVGDAVARASVLSSIVMIVAGIVCALHLRAAARASADASAVDPVARVRSSYVAAVSFVSVAIVVVSTIVLVYDFFRGVAPGVFSQSGSGSSVVVVRSMIPAFYLAVAALVILLAHLRHAPPPFRPGLLSRWSGGPTAPAATPPPSPVRAESPPEVLESEPPRPARRRAPRKTTD